VRAFDLLLRETAHRPRLVIAGQKGWLTDELFRFVERSGLAPHLAFTGYVSDADLRALYTACRLCVYPSLYEGFGLPPLEAMACGAAVVTSRIPVIEETVGAAARLVPPTDAAELARAIAELLADDAARAHYARAGRERAAEFTWERTARLTYDIYEEVLREWREEREAVRA
jgi:glycosyltransferase involved in cell wall biosynthesis